MDEPVHQLYQVSNENGNTKAVARCGAVMNYHRAESLALTMTGAHSRVTCSKCLGQSRDDDLKRWYEVLGQSAAVWHSIRDAVKKAKTAPR